MHRPDENGMIQCNRLSHRERKEEMSNSRTSRIHTMIRRNAHKTAHDSKKKTTACVNIDNQYTPNDRARRNGAHSVEGNIRGSKGRELRAVIL